MNKELKEFEDIINEIYNNAPQFDNLVNYLEDTGAIEWTETESIITAVILRGDNDMSMTFIKEPSVSKHYPYIRLRNRDYVMSSFVYIRILGTDKTYKVLHKGDRLVLS